MLDLEDELSGERPYIEVSALASINDIDLAMSKFKSEMNGNSSHMPAIGLMMGPLELEDHGHIDLRYPNIEELPILAKQAKGSAFVILHYNSNNAQNMFYDISSIMKGNGMYSSSLINGIQLSMGWPPEEKVDKIMCSFPDAKMILNLPKRSTQSLTPKDLANEFISSYRNVDYVLINILSDKGNKFNPERSAQIYSRIRDRNFHGTIGFFGGITPSNVEGIVKSLRTIIGSDDFSISAHNGLRDTVNREITSSKLNTDKVKCYIRGAVSGFNSFIIDKEKSKLTA